MRRKDDHSNPSTHFGKALAELRYRFDFTITELKRNGLSQRATVHIARAANSHRATLPFISERQEQIFTALFAAYETLARTRGDPEECIRSAIREMRETLTYALQKDCSISEKLGLHETLRLIWEELGPAPKT